MPSISLLAVSLMLCSRQAFGLTSAKYGYGAPSHITRPMQNKVTAASKAAYCRTTGSKNCRRNILQSNTRLTSTLTQARHIPRPFSWLPSFVHRTAPLQWASKLLRKRSSIRFVSGVILAAIVVFGPAFSPAARAATTAEAVSSSTAAAAARGVSPAAMPFSGQSRALGSFKLLPSKAELELCFRLLYSACAGAFVGLERSSTDRPAGVRTMALVGLGACTYTICSTHGFLPHVALGCAPGSPILENVKVDLSRMASSVASGVGFIGAGAIHKSKLYGNGSEAQNVVAGLTTAAAIWVSAAVGIASAVGLYFIAAVATFSTVAILKYARIPTKDDHEPGFSWEPRPLDIVEDTSPLQSNTRVYSSTRQDTLNGLFGKTVISDFDPQHQAFVDHDLTEEEDHPVILKEVLDRRFEQYLQSRLGSDKGGVLGQQNLLKETAKVLIEEEQEVISSNNTTDSDHDGSLEP